MQCPQYVVCGRSTGGGRRGRFPPSCVNAVGRRPTGRRHTPPCRSATTTSVAVAARLFGGSGAEAVAGEGWRPDNSLQASRICSTFVLSNRNRAALVQRRPLPAEPPPRPLSRRARRGAPGEGRTGALRRGGAGRRPVDGQDPRELDRRHGRGRRRPRRRNAPQAPGLSRFGSRLQWRSARDRPTRFPPICAMLWRAPVSKVKSRLETNEGRAVTPPRDSRRPRRKCCRSWRRRRRSPGTPRARRRRRA